MIVIGRQNPFGSIVDTAHDGMDFHIRRLVFKLLTSLADENPRRIPCCSNRCARGRACAVSVRKLGPRHR